ncbi:MAG TPA: UDP-3-O-(3-hydroxymyristoyl)glucosamine N-acyltransferase [Sphingomicrobium sp.]|nr:UDP-3-O-(3-hydroxymyristoyl)glucosamine N-acyltransferase [Sphingomicrobium sp.]
MADPRFFRRQGPFSLGYIGDSVGVELSSSSDRHIGIRDVAALEVAGPGELSVFYDPRYVHAFQETRAEAVITTRAFSQYAPAGTRLLFATDPRLALALIGHLFYPPPALEPRIDSLARIDPSARIGAGCRIEPGAVIGPGAEIGAQCHISANAVIAEGVVIGDGCRIGANASLSHALIGSRVEIGAGVVIGGPGFGFVPGGPHGPLRTPQLGRVIIENDVKIDANCAIDRGAHGDTVIGASSVLDNLVQIGHNVRVGRCCAISGQSGIAGSTVIGDGVMIGGQVAISDHLTIGAGARIALKSGVIRDVDPGTSVGGYPAMPVRQWHRETAGLARLFNRARKFRSRARQ